MLRFITPYFLFSLLKNYHLENLAQLFFKKAIPYILYLGYTLNILNTYRIIYTYIALKLLPLPPMRIVLYIGILLLAACSREYNQVMKSTDLELKKNAALKFYEKEEYDKVIPILEEYLTYFKGTNTTEDLLYKFAYSYYMQEDYIMSAFYFKNYLNNYPRGPKAEMAAFMMAESFKQESPRYSLDQTNTSKAINAYISFVDAYPNSGKIPDANKAIDELRAKLHKKAYESAYLYFKTKQYQAAAVSFKALLKDYPDIKEKDKIQYYIVKSYKLYAENSYDFKKLERYNDAVKEYQIFKEKYPESVYGEELKNIYDICNKEIQKLENNDGQKEGRL